MCVLIIKPSGVQTPSEDILNLAYKANPHGCGFATKNILFKTLCFSDFKRKLASVKIEDNCIIHFRLATHGSICKANCHPFIKDNVIFAHNGILSIRPIGDKTDSETAFLQVIYPLIKKFGLESFEVDNMVSSIIGTSRFAIMQGDNIRLYGDFTQLKGCYYSNLRFLHFSRNWYHL